MDFICLSISDGNLHIYTGFNADVGDLTHHFGRRMKIKDTFVNAHLPTIEGIGTFTARTFTNTQSQEFGGHTDRTRYFEVLTQSFVLEFGAYLLEGFDFGGSQCDANSVDSHLFRFRSFGWFDDRG